MFKLKISKHCPAMGRTRWALKVTLNPKFSMILQLIEKIFCFQGGDTHALIQRNRWSTEAMKWCKFSAALLGFGEIRSWFMLKDLPLLHSTPLRLKHATFTTTIPVSSNQTDLWNGKSNMFFCVISLASRHLRQRMVSGRRLHIQTLCELQLRVLFERHCFDSLFWLFEDIFVL